MKNSLKKFYEYMASDENLMYYIRIHAEWNEDSFLQMKRLAREVMKAYTAEDHYPKRFISYFMWKIPGRRFMDYKIRPILAGENSLLKDFLYEAIYVPEGMSAPPKSIINQPELQVYITDFGKKKDDIGLIAEVDKKVVGAVWVRIMNDYGHIDNFTPSFAISLYKYYRGFGIGTALMKEMLRILKGRGYKQASLAVQKANFAVSMYQKTGFEIAGQNEEEFIMLCRL